MKKLSTQKALKYLTCFLFLTSSICLANNPLDNQTSGKFSDLIVEKHEKSPFKVMLSGTFLSVSNPEQNTSISGLGVSFQVLYTLSSKFGLGGGAGTTMSQSGAGAATILNWAFTYSLTGNLRSTQSSYAINGREVLSGSNSLAEGFRAQLLFSQYYFNANESTIPYGGVGFQLYYDKYVEYFSTNAILGLRMDQLFNNDNTLTPLTLIFGILF